MHSPQFATDDRQTAAAGGTAPALHQLHAVSDQPIKRATIETRTPEDAAREMGAAILQTLRRSGRLDGISASRKTPAMLLLYAMCFEHGRVEEIGAGLVTLVVRKPLKEISAELKWLPTSAYRPARLLEDAKVIERIPARGACPDAYVICCGLPAATSDGARATCDATAQSVWPTCDASQVGHTEQNAKCATELDLARATCDARAVVHSQQDLHTRFDAENATVSGGARSDRSIRIRTDTFTSTQCAGGRGEEKNQREGDSGGSGGVDWLLPWLLSLPRMNPKVARKLARLPLISEKIATAARYELEHSTAAGKPDFNPAGLIFRILTNPHKQIGEAAWEHAAIHLGSSPDRPAAFAPSRLEDLFVRPAAAMVPSPSVPATPPAAEPAVSIEAEAVRMQQTISQAELAELHRQVIAAAPDAFTRTAWAKSNPRTSPAIHALIVRRIAAQQTTHNPQPSTSNSS